MIKIAKFIFNAFQENTYIVYDEDSLSAVIVDPGAWSSSEKTRLEDFIDSRKLAVKYIVATHGHLDHTAAVNVLAEKYGAQFVMSEADTVLEDQNRNISHLMGPGYEPLKAPDMFISDGDTLKAGPIELKVLATPGHTPGGVSLYMESDNVVFTGDTLFRGSIGRTDFPLSSYPDIIKSILKKIMLLPMDTQVLPGHGDMSDLAEERDRNPFINEVIDGQVDPTI